MIVEKISDYCDKDRYCCISDDHTIQSYYQKLIETRLPFASVIGSDNKYLGNIWAKDIKQLNINLKPEAMVSDLISKYPKVVEKQHILVDDQKIDWFSDILFKYPIVPVKSRGGNFVGSVDLLRVTQEKAIPDDLWSASSEKNVLVVDDEKQIADLIATGLKHYGYNTFVAYGGEEAKKLWQSGVEFSLCITDLMMPHCTGMDLIGFIRDIDKNLPIVVLTGYGEKKLIIECMRLGANDFHEKPVDLDILHFSMKKLEKLHILKRSNYLNLQKKIMLEDLNERLKSQLKEQAEQIKELQTDSESYLKLALLGEMAASIIHDIKNPLSIALYNANELSDAGSRLREKDKVKAEKLLISLDRVLKIMESTQANGKSWGVMIQNTMNLI